MSSPNTSNPWVHFAGQLIVPVLLLGYATHFYLSVARLPRPETNLLLIGPVYWLLLVCCVAFAVQRLVEAVRAGHGDAAGEDPLPELDLLRSLAFLVLTGGCIWAIFVLGFVVSTVTYTLLLLLVLGVRSLPVLLLTPTGLIGLIWVGMEHYLGLPLPTGLLI